MEAVDVDIHSPRHCALQNAASVASLILTTDCMVADIPQDDKPMPAGMEGMGGMPGMM